MTEIRCITTKQKKFLIKWCIALGIDVNELLEINNLTEAYKTIKELKQENAEIKSLLAMQKENNDMLNAKILELEGVYTTLANEIRMNDLERLWGVEVNERKETNS